MWLWLRLCISQWDFISHNGALFRTLNCISQLPFYFRYNTTSPTPYDQIRPTLLNPSKESASVSDTESLPSPCTSPPQPRRHYGESITNLGKASIMGEMEIIEEGWKCKTLAGSAGCIVCDIGVRLRFPNIEIMTVCLQLLSICSLKLLIWACKAINRNNSAKNLINRKQLGSVRHSWRFGNALTNNKSSRCVCVCWT